MTDGHIRTRVPVPFHVEKNSAVTGSIHGYLVDGVVAVVVCVDRPTGVIAGSATCGLLSGGVCTATLGAGTTAACVLCVGVVVLVVLVLC